MRFPRTLSRIAAAHPRIFRPFSHAARCRPCRDAPVNPDPLSSAGIALIFGLRPCVLERFESNGAAANARAYFADANERAYRDFIADPIGPPLHLDPSKVVAGTIDGDLFLHPSAEHRVPANPTRKDTTTT